FINADDRGAGDTSERKNKQKRCPSFPLRIHFDLSCSLSAKSVASTSSLEMAHSSVDDRAQVPPVITRATSSGRAPVIAGVIFVEEFVREIQNATTVATVTISKTVIARAATRTVANQPAVGSARSFRSASIRARNRELINGDETIRSISVSSMPPERTMSLVK